jgi:hypothetical protein
LANSLNQDWVGWSIEVCNADGAKFCSLPIDLATMTAVNERPSGVVALAS